MKLKKFEINTTNYALDTYLNQELNKIFKNNDFIDYFLQKIILNNISNLHDFKINNNEIYTTFDEINKYQFYLKNLLIKQSYFSFLTNYFKYSIKNFTLASLNLTFQQFTILKLNFKYFEFFKQVFEQILINHPNLYIYLNATTNLYLLNLTKTKYLTNINLPQKNKLKFIDYDDLISNLDDLINSNSVIFNSKNKLDLTLLTTNYLQIKKQELKTEILQIQQYLQIYIIQTTNNLFLIYIYQQKLYYKSITSFGFKGKTQNSKYSYKTFFDFFFTNLKKLTQTLNIISLPTIIFLKNSILNTSIKTFLKKLNNSEFLQIKSIYDITPQPYNGCKKKKIAIKKHNKAIVKYLSQIKIN